MGLGISISTPPRTPVDGGGQEALLDENGQPITLADGETVELE
jgi:hypothetical protein